MDHVVEVPPVRRAQAPAEALGIRTTVFSSPTAHVGRNAPAALETSHTAWCRWMMSTRGTLPSTYVRFGLNEVIQPSVGGRRPLGAIAIVFWPGLMRTGPKRIFMCIAPPGRGVVVIVPCAVRTVVARGLACAGAAATTTTRMAVHAAARPGRGTGGSSGDDRRAY